MKLIFVKRCWTSEDSDRCIKLFELSTKDGLVMSITATMRKTSKDVDIVFNKDIHELVREEETGYVHLIMKL